MTDERDDPWTDAEPYPPDPDDSTDSDDVDAPYELGLDETTLLGVRAVYQDVAYSVGNLGQHLRAIDRLWTVCVAAASFSESQSARQEFADKLEPVAESDTFETDLQPLTDAILFGRLDVDTRSREGWAPLRVSAISRYSPLSYDLTVHAQEVAPYAIAVGIFVRVMRDPAKLGSWLPRLVLGWKGGWKDVDNVDKEKPDLFALLEDRTELLISTMRDYLREISVGLSILTPESLKILNGEELPEGSNEARVFH